MDKPEGICDARNPYFPYFIIIGPVVLISIAMIFKYASKEDNSQWRLLISFIVPLLLLGISRIAWELVDTAGIATICKNL